jgi:hypothetical protein
LISPTPDFEARLQAVVAALGTTAEEDDLLNSDITLVMAGVSSPGVNVTREILLDSGTRGFHKPWDGVQTATAISFGHHPDDVPLNEALASRVGQVLGPPWDGLVAPCVLREIEGRPGSFVRAAEGEKGRADAPVLARQQSQAAALFDALIGQQDRHGGNFRFNEAIPKLTLYDHGYTFPPAGGLFGQSFLVAARNGGPLPPALEDWELEALDRLASDPELLGLRPMLLADRADMLSWRATRMRDDGRILAPGVWVA